MMIFILNRHSFIWGAALALIGVCFLNAETLDTPGHSDSIILTLDSIPEEVITRNPDLKSARWTIEAARGRMHQAGRLSNPTMQTTYQDNTQNAENTIGFGIQQSFPVTARLRLEKSVARHQIEEAMMEVETVARLRIESAMEWAVHLLGKRLRQRVVEEHIEIAKELTEFLEEQAKKGEASPLDATQAALLVDEHQLKLRPLQTESKRIESELRELLGLKPGDSVRLEDDLPPIKLPKASEMKLERRPEIQLISRQITTAQERLKLERSNRIEDFRLGLLHQWRREEDVPIGIEAERQYGLQLSVPLPFWNRNEGRVREVIADIKRLETSMTAMEISILNHVDASYTAMIEHALMYQEITEELLPRRKAYQKELEAAYRQGLVSFESLIRAREQWLKLRYAEVDSVESFHLSRIKYLSAIGNFSKTHEK